MNQTLAVKRLLDTRSRGFEPPTPGTGNQCSIRLSYERNLHTNDIIP